MCNILALVKTLKIILEIIKIRHKNFIFFIYNLINILKLIELIENKFKKLCLCDFMRFSANLIYLIYMVH
jgi:hypothetical protein